MSVANLTITSFSVDPSKAASVPDIYSEGGLSELNKPSALDEADGLSGMISDLTPKQVTELLENEDFKSFVDESKTTVKGAVEKIESVLPKSAGSASELLASAKDGNFMDSFKAAKRMKESMPSSGYNNIQKDVFNKTVELTGGITNKLNPLGDYFCKKNTATTFGDKGFDLDKAIEAALKGATLAIAALGKCGLDSVSVIDDMDATEGLKAAVGLFVATDGAENGVLDTVSDLSVRFKDSFSDSENSSLASGIASSFVPGESTNADEQGTFLDTLGDLVPNFLKPGEPERGSLLSRMSDATLDLISGDEGMVYDAQMVKGSRQFGDDSSAILDGYSFDLTA